MQIKAATLREIADAYNTPAWVDVMPVQVHRDLLGMVAENAFRPLPFPVPVIDEVEDVAWPHLSLVYGVAEAALRATVFPGIDEAFLRQLVRLLLQPDERERTAVEKMIELVLERVPALSSVVEERVVQEIENEPPGRSLSHLLRLGRLFQVPGEVLLGVHARSDIHLYGKELIAISRSVAVRDACFAETLTAQLLDFWPVGNHEKICVFIEELRSLSTLKFALPMAEMVGRVAGELDRSHAVVVRRALEFLQHWPAQRWIQSNPKEFHALVIPRALRACRHWSREASRFVQEAFKGWIRDMPEVFGLHQEEEEWQDAEVAEVQGARDAWIGIAMLANEPVGTFLRIRGFFTPGDEVAVQGVLDEDRPVVLSRLLDEDSQPT